MIIFNYGFNKINYKQIIEMKKTPFTSIHEALGAKMVEFAGFYMPIEYSGITDEHMTIRGGVGVFDVSHMGEFWVKGPKALLYLQTITSNDVSKLIIGKAQYACFPNGKGGIVDDLLVYRFAEEKYMLVVNAANIDKDWAWCNKNLIDGVEIENASDRMAQLAIQGPKAKEVLQKLTETNLDSIPYYSFKTDVFAGVEEVIISNTGYTGAGGFEIYFYPEYAEKIWSAIFEAGTSEGIKPIGLAARDTLRLEMGYCLYGNDINDTTSAIEAGLGWITKFSDDKPLVDGDLLLLQKNEGVDKQLKGFVLEERGIPRHDYEICSEDGSVIGIVTSGTMSPILKQGIGLGYIDSRFTQLNTVIYIKVRNKLLKAKVVKLPFVKGTI